MTKEQWAEAQHKNNTDKDTTKLRQELVAHYYKCRELHPLDPYAEVVE